MTIREQALAFATEAHKGQKRKDGKDYISHPIAVAEIAEKLAKEYGISDFYLDDLYVISAFHDIWEDQPQYGPAMLNQFGGYILAKVQVLSRQEGETYFDFIRRIISHYRDFADPLPLLTKQADLIHNMSDLQEGSMKDKYRFAHYILDQALKS